MVGLSIFEENRAKFFAVSLSVPLEEGLPQGYKGHRHKSNLLSRGRLSTHHDSVWAVNTIIGIEQVGTLSCTRVMRLAMFFIQSDDSSLESSDTELDNKNGGNKRKSGKSKS